jgi:hypothetical protein
MRIIMGHKNRATGLGFILVLALLLPGRPAEAKAPAGVDAPGGDGNPGGPVAVNQPRRAILSRGNEMVRGLPGFAENAFPALYGHYRLELPGLTGTAPDFSLWLCREPLYLSDTRWRLTLSGGDYSRYHQTEAAGLLVAVLPDGEEPWTVLFRFPAASCRALEPVGLTRLIEAWLARFFYFASLAEDPQAISLPAALTF